MENKDTLLESASINISVSADEAIDYLWSVTVAESEKECTTLARFNFEDVYIF